MDKFIDLISKEVKQAFGEAGYEGELGRVTLSNRPDLCEYQCNGAMAGAKRYHKAPLAIAEDVADKLKESNVFSEAAAVAPGFLNLKVKETFLKEYLEEMRQDEKFGVAAPEHPQKIIVDYGGPNVAKPLHVGHLRSAIIGESIKRICRFMGHDVLGDIHMGDWGLQMGLIITELRQREPELVYFDETYQGDYPEEAPFTISELEEIYPTASAKSKEDAAYKAQAMEDTYRLQNGVPGIRALWQHIMQISVSDLKKNYAALDVEFDLWKGESDVHDIIPGMVEEMKKGGFAHESEGALVVDVKEDTDTKEIPPCMILKSDGASLYNTTDLATIVDRMALYQPDKLIYLADKRQDLYFEQVFRCARKTGLVKPETQLIHIGFGTMNGRDGKPFKTRDGGVMRLETLIHEIHEEMYGKIAGNPSMSREEAEETSRIVALSAVKYGDLSNQASKDYIFDMERFTSFEGDTGPYILYTIVRIKSILAKYKEQADGTLTESGKAQAESDKAHTETGMAESASGKKNVAIREAAGASEKDLMLELAKFNAMMEAAYEEVAPHRICAYIYDLANAFNHFYHETKILTEEDREKQEGWIALLQLTKAVLETSIDLLGFSAPERM